MKSLFSILVLSLLINIAHADIILGRVVGVADGDTITILDSSHKQYKIRLSGIDAPEKKQPFGNVSKRSLSDLVYDKQVEVEWNKEDRYGRTVGKVLIDGLDVNLEQVKRGMAWFYKKYQNELVLNDRLSYLHAQGTAEKMRVGLWVEDAPTSPWDFRKQRK